MSKKVRGMRFFFYCREVTADLVNTVELELWRKGQLVPDDDDDELEDPKAVATTSLSTESSDPAGKMITK